MAEVHVRPLEPGDDRSAFHSGDDDLDRFFHRFTGQNQFRHHVGTTYVAAVEGTIVGYATVVASHLEAESLPARLRASLRIRSRFSDWRDSRWTSEQRGRASVSSCCVPSSLSLGAWHPMSDASVSSWTRSHKPSPSTSASASSISTPPQEDSATARNPF